MGNMSNYMGILPVATTGTIDKVVKEVKKDPFYFDNLLFRLQQGANPSIANRVILLNDFFLNKTISKRPSEIDNFFNTPLLIYRLLEAQLFYDSASKLILQSYGDLNLFGKKNIRTLPKIREETWKLIGDEYEKDELYLDKIFSRIEGSPIVEGDNPFIARFLDRAPDEYQRFVPDKLKCSFEVTKVIPEIVRAFSLFMYRLLEYETEKTNFEIMFG